MVECDQDKCMFCGGCVAVCPKDAIVVFEARTMIDLGLCTECGNCATVCPVGAITIP